MSQEPYELVQKLHQCGLDALAREPSMPESSQPHERLADNGLASYSTPELVQGMHKAALAGGKSVDEVPDLPQGEPLAHEWNRFKQQLSFLIEQGHLGRFAVVKEDHPITVWDTPRDALQAGSLLYGSEPFLVQEIQLFLRTFRWGYYRPCRD